jgi:chloramphenicol-sensitive protein RarD
VDSRRGLASGAAAYTIWGVFPLYFALLEPAGAVEILAHRILWSAVTMGLLILLLRRTSRLVGTWRDRRVLLYLGVAATAISVNWGVYIYGVNNGRVVEASLGYFINPLVTVLMGVFVLGERLRAVQWVAMGIAGVAVVVLTVDYGRPPWVAIALALSFGTYGLAKKKAGAGPLESLTIETMLIAPVAALYISWLVTRGSSDFGAHGIGHASLLMSTGIVTAVPLVLFGAAAIRISMVSIGLLQYLAPILQFVVGVVLLHEDMPLGRWVGFALVRTALESFADIVANRSA